MLLFLFVKHMSNFWFTTLPHPPLPKCHWSTLPDEVIIQILSHLDSASLGMFALVSVKDFIFVLHHFPHHERQKTWLLVNAERNKHWAIVKWIHANMMLQWGERKWFGWLYHYRCEMGLQYVTAWLEYG